MNAVLIPLAGGAAIPLDKAIVFFGRGSECDVVLTDSRKVSRKHCCVAQINNQIVIRDLGSMNGLRINDEQIKGEGKLNSGDVLWVGDLGFRLETANSAARNQKAPPISKRVPLPAKKKSKPTIDPSLLSQDIPVAIPQPGDQFRIRSVEQDGMIPEDEIIELRDSAILEE